MWTKENRGRYDRSRLRYPSDLTDEEWALVEPLIPPAKRGGNKRTVNMREVVNGADVCFEHRLPVAGDPEGLAAALDGVRLFRSVELGRHARSHPSTRSTANVARRADAKQVPPPPSSTAKASKALKKILCGWTAA